MSKPVIIHLKNPIFGGGVLTDRAVLHEKVFTEEVMGKDYQKLAKQWSITHESNVLKIEGLDDETEKPVVSRKKKEESSE